MRAPGRLLPMRFGRREIAGGFGDTGLFLPIAIALIAINGLAATSVFAVAGLAYIGTALYFRVPVPVQPLKAFAAAAIALRLDADVIAAGALLMSASMLFLSSTGLANWIAARFPLILVRGIQASVALLLAKAAVELAARGNWEGLVGIEPGVSYALAAVACAFLLVSRSARSLPGTLIVLGCGAVVGFVLGNHPAVGLGPEAPSMSLPSEAAFGTALTTLVLAQIPLTLGNAVVATADAERRYFGAAARRVTPKGLAASIGFADLGAGLLSGLPLCHGAGGATAHYKLGARTAGATLSIGIAYLLLALLFGASIPALVQVIVPGALAGMLLFVALEHALLAAELEHLEDRLICAGIGAVTLLSGNLAIGVAAGAAVLLARRAGRAAGRATQPVASAVEEGR